jgi:hypothetical protein
MAVRFGAREPQSYRCTRCDDIFPCNTHDEYTVIGMHRVLHLCIEWEKSLREVTEWTVDPDGGMRPVVQ